MATRDLSTAVSNALDDTVIEPFFAADLLFDDDDDTQWHEVGYTGENAVYVWTGLGTTTIDSKNYTGVGELIQISLVNETGEIAAKGASITLSGIPNDSDLSLGLALTEPYQGRIGKLYFGVMGTKTAYTEIFTGYMDEMNISEGPESSTIELTLENKLLDLERPRIARYSSQYQRSKYPTDGSLDYVENMMTKTVAWGREES